MQPIRKQRLNLALAGLAVLGLMLGIAGPAAAQFRTGFEVIDGYQAAPDGSVIVSGQNGWYNPNPAQSDDEWVLTYDGNFLNLPPNPNGGDQFLGAMALGDGNSPRAQHDIDMSAGGIWTISFDLCVSHNGTSHYANNISSFSMSDGVVLNDAYFISLNVWRKPSSAHRGRRNATWRAFLEVYDSTGAGPILLQPPKALRRFALNNWYRESITVDVDNNQVLSVSFTDLTTGTTITTSSRFWYMFGGQGAPPPTAFRFFVGAGANVQIPGNIMGWDNVSFAPGGPAPAGGKVISLTDADWQVSDKVFPATH